MTPAIFYLLIAIALIGLELLIMQLSVFWFLFIGLGALVTSLVGWLFPEISWVSATLLFIVASVVISVLLYRPLKRWQDKPGPMPGNDAIGQVTEVVEAVTREKSGTVIWSGTEWPAELAKDEAALEAGERAVIRRLEGIRLIVGR